MEASRVMTDDEVRDVFSAYHDRELDPESSEAVRVALEAKPSLKRDYESFCVMLQTLGAMADEPTPGLTPGASRAPKVDLLHGVQNRLNKRSRGRFYGDRWSRVAGLFPLEVLAVLVLVALMVSYFAMTSINVQQGNVQQGNGQQGNGQQGSTHERSQDSTAPR